MSNRPGVESGAATTTEQHTQDQYARGPVFTAPTANAPHWSRGELSWSELPEFLGLDDPAAEKECGGYVLGELRPTTRAHGEGKHKTKPHKALHRNAEAVVSRWVLALDADSTEPDLIDHVRELGVATIYHTTAYHLRPKEGAPATLRYRLLFLLDREVTPVEYEALADELMERLGVDQFDTSCNQPERFMWRPSTVNHELYEHGVLEGPPLDTTALLADHLDRAVDEPEAAPRGSTGSVERPEVTPEYEHHVRADIEWTLGKLDDLCAAEHEGATVLWPGAHAPDKPPGEVGWDHGAFLAAQRLVQAANAGIGYELDDAERDFMEHAPARHDQYNPAHKWQQGVETTGDRPTPPPTRSSAAEDFAGFIEEEEGEDLASSWSPIDLTPYVNGTFTPRVPQYLTRLDGMSLLYPGLTHSLHGEPESGKSFVMQYLAAQLINQGEYVLYLDFEADEPSLVERLFAFGARPEAILQRFVYLRPLTDPVRSRADRAAFNAVLDRHHYALVVIDGVSQSMALMLADTKDPNAAAIEWSAKLPRPVADRTGAAVVQIDHVTKSSEGRGRFAIGGQAKLAALTGAAYMIDVAEPLAKGIRGELRLWVAKDRPGYVRGRCGEFSANRLQQAARIVVDSTGDLIDVAVLPPSADHVFTGDALHRQRMEAVSKYLAGLDEAEFPRGASSALVRKAVRGRNELVDTACVQLAQEGYITRTKIGNGFYHRHVRLYDPDLINLPETEKEDG